MSNSTSHFLDYPIANARFSLPLSFRTSAGTPTDPTVSDTEFSSDGGASFADTAEEITTGGLNGMGYLTLTGAETNNRMLLIASKSSNCVTTPAILQPRVLPIISNGTLSAGSSGGGTLGTILAYDITGCYIRTTGGTGGGGTGGANNQARRIITYTPSTGAFTVPTWETTPDATTTYDILLPEGATFGSLKAVNPVTPGTLMALTAAGGVTLGDAVSHGGTLGSSTATFALSRINVTSQTSNTSAFTLLGNGSGHGFDTSGGATGNGIDANGGATSGNGLDTAAQTSGHGFNTTGVGNTKHGLNATGGATASDGFRATGGGTGHGANFQSGTGIAASGIVLQSNAATAGWGLAATGSLAGEGFLITGGTTGAAMNLTGGAISGDGLKVTTTVGHGFNITAVGTAKDGIHLIASGTGVGFSADDFVVTGTTTHTGAVSFGSTFTVTGATTFAAISGTTLTLSGAVAFQSTFAVSGATSLTGLSTGALSCSTLTATGAVAFQSTTTLSGAVLATNASNDIRGVSATVTDKTGFSLANGSIATATFAAGAINSTVAPNLDAAVSSRMATYTQPTGFLAASFPAAVADNTNVSAVGAAVLVVGSAVAAVQADTDDIQTRLPATLVSGRMDSSVGSYPGNTAQTGDSFARIGVNGAGLTSLAQSSIWTGALATSLTTLAGHDPGSTLASAIAVAALPTANQNAAAILAATITELSAVPDPDPTLSEAIALLFMALRNKITVDATTKKVHNDAGAAIGTKTLTDDGTTYAESVMA